MGELAVEHVEAQLTALVAVLARGNELELRLRVDEATDEPGASHAIDVDAGPGHPGRAARLLDGARGRRLSFRCAQGDPLLHLFEEPIYCLAAATVEEVDDGNLAHSLLQAGKRRL